MSDQVSTSERPALPDFDHPHGWTWRNDLRAPSSLHVEPAFLDHLGDVFVRIDQGGQHLGIWLTRAVMEQFIAAMRSAADAPEYDAPDGDGS
jgi:hypothetical protein